MPRTTVRALTVRVSLVNESIDVHRELKRLDGAPQLLGLNVTSLVNVSTHRHERVDEVALVILLGRGLLLRLDDLEKLRELNAAAPIVVNLRRSRRGPHGISGMVDEQVGSFRACLATSEVRLDISRAVTTVTSEP